MTARTADSPQLWADTAGTEVSSSPLAAAFLVACLIHLFLILGVGFVFPETNPGKQAARTLEITVLRQAVSSAEKPEIADAFAQVDRDGGGIETASDTEAIPGFEPVPEMLAPDPEPALMELPPQPIPPPLPEPDEPEPAIPEQPVDPTLLSATEPEPKPEPVSLLQPPHPLEEPPVEPAPPQVTAAEILVSRNLEIAELTARIQHSSAAYASRLRRKAISASTREYKYASYLEAWRRKVERVGNLNYPEEAKRHKLYGNLILHVAVRADGSIERVSVLRSSGFDLLDEAAVKIVQLAAPYAPFPPDIRAETDVLDITRTWQFLSSNRLGWEN